jgi:hypothetical protein
VEQEPLGDLQVIVGAALVLELLGRLGELVDGLAGHPLFRVELGQLDPVGDGLRIELDDLLERGQRLASLALAVVERGHRLVLLHRIREQSELFVEIGQPLVHFDQPRIDLEDLFVDRDGL